MAFTCIGWRQALRMVQLSVKWYTAPEPLYSMREGHIPTQTDSDDDAVFIEESPEMLPVIPCHRYREALNKGIVAIEHYADTPEISPPSTQCKPFVHNQPKEPRK